jgi:hypothetical protein
MIRVWLGRLDNIKKENMAFMTIREAAKLVNDFFSTVNGSANDFDFIAQLAQAIASQPGLSPYSCFE